MDLPSSKTSLLKVSAGAQRKARLGPCPENSSLVGRSRAPPFRTLSLQFGPAPAHSKAYMLHNAAKALGGAFLAARSTGDPPAWLQTGLSPPPNACQPHGPGRGTGVRKEKQPPDACREWAKLPPGPRLGEAALRASPHPRPCLAKAQQPTERRCQKQARKCRQANTAVVGSAARLFWATAAGLVCQPCHLPPGTRLGKACSLAPRS